MIASLRCHVAHTASIIFALSICVTAGHAFPLQGAYPEAPPASARSQENSPEAVRHFAAAQAAEARFDLETASREYEAAIQIAPQWAEAIVNLGIIYNRQVKVDRAIAAFTRAAEINPRLLAAQLNLAITYFRARRFREAEPPLRNALEIDPSNSQAEGLLMLTLFALDRFADVVELAEKRNTGANSDAAMVEILGRAYLKLHRYAQAVRTLEIRAGLPPASAEVYLALGEARDNAGDSEGAIREFGRAIGMGGALPELHFALGYVLWKMRRYEEAEVAFRHELERDSRHDRSIYYLGNIALSRGDWKTAVQLLEQASRAMPSDFAARYDFAKALLQVKEAGRAVEEARAAIALKPKHSGAHYQLGLAYRELKQEEESQREFALARELNKAEREDLDQKVQGEERKKRPEDR